LADSQDFELLLARLDWQPAAPEAPTAVEILAARGRWREAVGRARAAVRNGADQPGLFVALAKGALRAGRVDRCLKTLDRLDEDGETSRELLDLRVRALLQENRKHEARVALERYLLTHRDDREVWEARRKLMPGGPGIRMSDPAVTLRWAARLARAGELDRSARLLRRMLAQYPGEPTLRRALAQVEQRLGGRR
jgi:predicted Zn-dependent protease